MKKRFDGHPSLEEVLNDARNDSRPYYKSKLDNAFDDKGFTRRSYSQEHKLDIKVLTNALKGHFDRENMMSEKEKRVVQQLTQDGVI